MLESNYKSTVESYRVELGREPTRASHRDLRREVIAALDSGETRIEIDCASWSELDLNSLSALVSCARACNQRGAAFDMTNLGGNMRSMIDSLRLSSRLGLAD